MDSKDAKMIVASNLTIAAMLRDLQIEVKNVKATQPSEIFKPGMEATESALRSYKEIFKSL
jgi:hypothetical protein